MALDRQPQARKVGLAVAGNTSRVVSIAVTRPSAMSMPVTSQFSTMSTPRMSAPRA